MNNNLFLLWSVMILFPVFFGHKTPRPPYSGIVPAPPIELVPDDTTGAVFYDDFMGGSFSQWVGDTASFEVVNGSLGPVADARPPMAIAVSTSRLRNTMWEAGVIMTGAFSASNYLRLYLAATSPAFQDPQWGYYLQIDGSGSSHVYRLWRQNGPTRTIVFESNPINRPVDTFRARIRVTCTQAADWQVAVDEQGDGVFQLLANKSNNTTVRDSTYRSGAYSGFLISFSMAGRLDFKLDYLLIKRLDRSPVPDISDMPQAGDILINEVLSNPKSGGADFLEIYNYSDKTIDLSGVSIASVNTNGVAGNQQWVSDQPLFLHSNEYKVLTRQPAVVMQHYPNAESSAFIEMSSLPNFNNETGGVVIYGQGGVIDSLFYTPAMQSPFIASNRGVSLERQHFSVPTNAPGSFRSAATAVGGATPGYQNSQYVEGSVGDDVFFTSKTFSPDNDGFEDRLEINYRFSESGFMANIDIYTDQGRLIKRLLRNQSIATQGTIYWDGLSDANTRLPVGMYIAVMEVYNANGAHKVYRKSFVLAARL